MDVAITNRAKNTIIIDYLRLIADARTIHSWANLKQPSMVYFHIHLVCSIDYFTYTRFPLLHTFVHFSAIELTVQQGITAEAWINYSSLNYINL